MEKAGTILHLSLIASTEINNMKTRTKFSILLAAIATAFGAVLMTGCSVIPKITPALVQSQVHNVVAFGVEKAPQAIPELRIADNVICAAAAGTNVEPSSIVTNLELAGVISANSPEAVLIANSAIGIYDGIFQSFGSNWVANTTLLQQYLQAVCSGINEGLPPDTTAIARSKPLAPHIRK